MKEMKKETFDFSEALRRMKERMLDVKIANTSLLYAEAAVSIKLYHTERVCLICSL